MRTLAFVLLLSLTTSSVAGPARPKRSVTRDLYSIHVHDCTEFKRGSVAHRGCRGAEWRRLQETCNALKREDHALAGEFCAAADRYQIVE